MGLRIQEVDTRTASEELLREMHDYYVPMARELLPDDPPTPFEQQSATWRNLLEHERIPRWLLRDGDEIVAVAVAVINLVNNTENGFARIHVRPDRRRQGLARTLADPVLDTLQDAHCVRLDTWAKTDGEGGAYAEKLGLKPVYQDKRSRLVLAELDHDLMRGWIERASERAADYELLYIETPFPDELLQKLSDLTAIMNTAPREDYEAEDEVFTADMWRDIQESQIAGGNTLHAYIAVHRPSGEFAGYTTIQTQGHQPHQAWQWDTGVDPAHRNKGLGRWLKAAMIERIVAEHPEVAWVDTSNAGSNKPMLNINIAMGFRPLLMTTGWQGDLALARERLGDLGAVIRG